MDVEGTAYIFERRKEILNYNNNCILKTVISYEKFFLDNIIKRIYFNDKSWTSKQLTKFLNDRMNFMDRFKLVKEIGLENDIRSISQSKIEKFIEIRNNIAHNLSYVNGFDTHTNKMDINFAGKYIEWKEYLKEIKEWSNINLEVAEYTKNVFQAINTISKLTVCYMNYNFEKNCILVENMLFPDDLNIESNVKIEEKLSPDLLKFAIDEEKYLKMNI